METFVIIKPDAVERGLVGEIIKRFEQKGLAILRIEQRYKTRVWCALHYSSPDLPTGVYQILQEAMTNKPLIGIVLAGLNVVPEVRRMIGATNSSQAWPGTIRGDFGTLPVHKNLIHAADTQELAIWEAGLFFNSRTDTRHENAQTT
jgi:nucleoside-diphosphate kinase